MSPECHFATIRRLTAIIGPARANIPQSAASAVGGFGCAPTGTLVNCFTERAGGACQPAQQRSIIACHIDTPLYRFETTRNRKRRLVWMNWCGNCRVALGEMRSVIFTDVRHGFRWDEWRLESNIGAGADAGPRRPKEELP